VLHGPYDSNVNLGKIFDASMHYTFLGDTLFIDYMGVQGDR